MSTNTEACPPPTHKTCTKCGETKPVTEFNVFRRAKDGRASQCKPCKQAFDMKRRFKRPFEASVNNARRRALQAGVPFDLTEEYLESIWTGSCPVFHTRLSLPNREKGSKLTPTRPALDRLIPHRGYVPGNVIWLSKRANNMKSDGNSAELYRVAAWLEQTEKELERHEAD